MLYMCVGGGGTSQYGSTHTYATYTESTVALGSTRSATGRRLKEEKQFSFSFSFLHTQVYEYTVVPFYYNFIISIISYPILIFISRYTG